MGGHEDYLKQLYDAGLQWDKRGAMSAVKASCRKCGTVHEMNLAVHLPVDQIVKKIRAKGWVDKRRAWACTSCLNAHDDDAVVVDAGHFKNSKERAREDANKVFELIPGSTVHALPAQQYVPEKGPPVKPSYRQIRLAMELIANNFDVPNGTWLGEWSDGRLANEVGIERGTARLMREDAFGKLNKPPEIDQLLSDVKAATEMLDDIRNRISELAARFD